MDPVLIDVPEELTTQRLLIRPPRAGDGAEVNAAVVESAAELQPWMPWANPVPSVEDTEIWCRKSAADFMARRTLMYQMHRRDTGTFVGGCGIFQINWDVRSFEIGYWVRTTLARQGYVTEAVARLTRFLLDELQAARVEIRMDDNNTRSSLVPQRAGFTLEGVFRNHVRGLDGTLRSTLVYARIADDTGRE